jgi:hypothetical protein
MTGLKAVRGQDTDCRAARLRVQWSVRDFRLQRCSTSVAPSWRSCSALRSGFVAECRHHQGALRGTSQPPVSNDKRPMWA